MYNNPFNIYTPQDNIDRINTQINELERAKARFQQPAPITQNFQFTPPTSDAINERLNRIQNLNKIEGEKFEKDDDNIEDGSEANNIPMDLNKLKIKVKMDNAPALKEVKELDKNMKKIKNEFAEAKNSDISNERFGNYINQANEMFKN